MQADIEINQNGRGSIQLDGQRITGVRGFRVASTAGRTAELELDLIVHGDERINFSGEVAVIVPAKTAETLKALGWTPPSE